MALWTRRRALARSQFEILKVSAMIRFYFQPTPNPAKVALFLEESGLTYELVPVDTSKGEQHQPSFRRQSQRQGARHVDTEGPGGKETRVFDSSAILLHLAEKTGRLLGQPADRGELLSWLFFLGTGLGPFSGQAVHFQFAAPTASTTPSTDIAAKLSATIAYSTVNSPAETTSSGPTTRSSTCPPGAGSIAPRV
jgi:glutathione S-transferase